MERSSDSRISLDYSWVGAAATGEIYFGCIRCSVPARFSSSHFATAFRVGCNASAVFVRRHSARPALAVDRYFRANPRSTRLWSLAVRKLVAMPSGDALKSLWCEADKPAAVFSSRRQWAFSQRTGIHLLPSMPGRRLAMIEDEAHRPPFHVIAGCLHKKS